MAHLHLEGQVLVAYTRLVVVGSCTSLKVQGLPAYVCTAR